MTREEVMDNMKFRHRCCDYGLNWDEFDIYNDVILVYTPKKNLYLVLDKKFNVIGIKDNTCGNIETFANDIYHEYSSFTDIITSSWNLGYPFEKYTLKNINDIASDIEINFTNHGHSSSLILKDKKDYIDNEDIIQLLYYIKFLYDEMNKYFLYEYHMNLMGFELPSIYEYLKALISKINELILMSIEKNKYPASYDILTSMGKNRNDLGLDLLENITELIMRDRGFILGNRSKKEILTISLPNEDLSIKANNLLNYYYDEDNITKEQKDSVFTKKLSKNNL